MCFENSNEGDLWRKWTKPTNYPVQTSEELELEDPIPWTSLASPRIPFFFYHPAPSNIKFMWNLYI